MVSLQSLFLTFAVSLIPSWPATALAQTTLIPVNDPVEGSPAGFNPVAIPGLSTAGEPVLENFVSFSIETAFFPDFAGNTSVPNTFSQNLLEGIKEFQGSLPNVRVGGNTQDFALFDSTLKSATRGIYSAVTNDYPTTLSIGPSFFESYQTWPGVKFIHGFNLAKNDTVSAKLLIDSVARACKALSNGNFLYWEMGNEPDLYKQYPQGSTRPATWSEADYVKEWNDKVESIKDALRSKCGEAWTSKEMFKWIAPSFAGTKNGLNLIKSWNAGLDRIDVVAKFSTHNYIGGATQPGVTLAGTLLNHTKTVASIGVHNAEQHSLAVAGMKHDYILGEANSLYHQGAPGLSNSFGAALWGVDFNLMAAATNIKQVFMHQGTDYRYASWQPISTNKTTMGTKSPYYGNIAVAAALGNLAKSSVRVANVPLNKSTEAAYAIYSNTTLSRLMIINMNEYNYTVPKPSSRPGLSFNFTTPASCKGVGLVQRLIANGSDAVSGISFNGMSWNYELDGGKGKLLGNMTRDEVVWVASNGDVSVHVPDSSAALVQLTC